MFLIGNRTILLLTNKSSVYQNFTVSLSKVKAKSVIIKNKNNIFCTTKENPNDAEWFHEDKIDVSQVDPQKESGEKKIFA